MKKALSILIAVVFVSASAVPVFAHGSHYVRSRVVYSVCGVSDCDQTGLHAHDGVNYYAHYYNDGHDYHGYCDIGGCDLVGYHSHDGVYCFGHANSYGGGYGGYVGGYGRHGGHCW